MNNECDLRNFWKKSRQRGEGSVKSSLESFSRPKGLGTGLNDYIGSPFPGYLVWRGLPGTMCPVNNRYALRASASFCRRRLLRDLKTSTRD